MTLIVEDGSVVAGANSFITVAEWEAYLTLYGKMATGNTTAKETALIKAQRAISTRYTFDGTPVEQEQSTCLPRTWTKAVRGFVPASDAVLQDFKDAQAELAYDIQHGADPFATRTSRGENVTSETSKAGPVETSVTYGGGGSNYDSLDMSNYTASHALLRPYLAAGSGGAQIRLERA